MFKFLNFLYKNTKNWPGIQVATKQAFHQVSNNRKSPISRTIPSLITASLFTKALFSKASNFKSTKTETIDPNQEKRLEGFITALNTEKEILELLELAEYFYNENRFVEAKVHLINAMNLAEKKNVFVDITVIYELLAEICFKEGNVENAEKMLVQFIEKLQQLGYGENHNSIIRYKLKLSRLYAMVGENVMAEIGFRNCIEMQEDKIKLNRSDASANFIYISCLYWYSRFLTDINCLDDARKYMKKAIAQLNQPHGIPPMQIMSVYYHMAEISYKLVEYDDAIYWLMNAVALSRDFDELSEDFPAYLVKLGVCFMQKGFLDKAQFWCDAGLKFAEFYKNEIVKEEALVCLKRIKELIVINEKK